MLIYHTHTCKHHSYTQVFLNVQYPLTKFFFQKLFVILFASNGFSDKQLSQTAVMPSCINLNISNVVQQKDAGSFNIGLQMQPYELVFYIVELRLFNTHTGTLENYTLRQLSSKTRCDSALLLLCSQQLKHKQTLNTNFFGFKSPTNLYLYITLFCENVYIHVYECNYENGIVRMEL